MAGASKAKPTPYTERIQSWSGDAAASLRRIFSRGRLLDLAYDDTADVTERAIDSHIKNLRRKLAAASPDHDWIRSVYGVGFAFEAPAT